MPKNLKNERNKSILIFSKLIQTKFHLTPRPRQLEGQSRSAILTRDELPCVCLVNLVTCAYQGIRNVCFLKNLTWFVFLKQPFWDSPFCRITEEVKLSNNVLPFYFQDVLWSGTLPCYFETTGNRDSSWVSGFIKENLM